MGLLAAEMTARTAAIGELYRDLTRELGDPVYERIDAPATPEEGRRSRLTARDHPSRSWLEIRLLRFSTTVPDDDRPIGGSIVTEHGSSPRPLGTKAVYKRYAES